MKYVMMILAAMALAGCSFDFIDCQKDEHGKCPTWSTTDDVLANSHDTDDDEAGDEVKFNPPPLNDTDTKPILVDTDVAPTDDNDGNVDHPLSDTDAGETIPSVDTADTDSIDTPADTSADGDSIGDTDDGDTAEPQTDAPDAYDAPETEADSTLPCIPNCAGKQCGNNGCDGSCGACLDSYICNADFVCECTVGCQIPAEPTTDATDATNAADADASMTPTADADAEDSAASPDETGGPTAEMTVTMDATVDAPQGETSPSIDALVNAEPSTDTNVAEVAAETVNDEDVVTTTETATLIDVMAETEAEIDEDTTGEPDTFVLPCLANPLFCDDGNECTADTCTVDGCQHESQTGKACNDGSACTESDICDKDVCAGKTITCNDQNPCTNDSCDKQSGCEHAPNNSNPCEDGSLCTVGDFCDAGKCQGGQALKCDDENICTDDVCQPQKGCVYPANQVGCDDGNSCTVGDICADMTCESGTNICQCQSDTDCANADDENLCNGTIVCDQSAMPFVCVTDPNTIITCNVSQDTACLKNTCVPATGDCQMTAVNEGGGCDDGNACTSNDQCADGSCAGQSIKCDDNNVCTDDSCNSASGCVFTPNNADCDDGSVCTMLDVCQGGQCIGTAPLDCDDGKECTLDICHKALECQHSKTAMNGQACDTGDACTVNDTCQNGACQAGTQNNCDCYTTADCAGKEDGNLCNGTLFCDTDAMPYICVLDPTTIITCNASQDTACSKNTCQPASGKCEMKAVNEGVTCQSGQCIVSATCQVGQCAVVNKPDDTECDDGKECSVGDACQNGVCKSDTPFYVEDFSDGKPEGWIVSHPPNGDWIKIKFDNGILRFLAPAGSETDKIFATSPAIILPSGDLILSGNFLEHDLKFSEIRILEAATDKILLSLPMKSGYEILQTFSVNLTSLGGTAIKIMCFSDMQYYGWVDWDNLTVGCP